MYIDNFHYDICESNVKHYKKSSRIQFGVFLFNLICFSTYLYFLINYHDKAGVWGFGVGLGAFFISMFWSLLFTLETFGEYKGEKAQLIHFKKLRNEHRFYETIESLEATKTEYERLLKNIKKSNFGAGGVGNNCQIVVSSSTDGHGEGGVSSGSIGSTKGCGHAGHS